MSQRQSVPYIPDNAPFTPSQRAWLNGLLAGMFCRTTAPAAVEQHAAAKPKLSVFVGSQSGNAESLAKRFIKEAKKQDYEATVVGLDKVTLATLAEEKFALVITSTWGEGDPPDNAAAFWEQLKEDNDVAEPETEPFNCGASSNRTVFFKASKTPRIFVLRQVPRADDRHPCRIRKNSHSSYPLGQGPATRVKTRLPPGCSQTVN
jgi:sulfite reductase alpha subunit-like flavoprotein